MSATGRYKQVRRWLRPGKMKRKASELVNRHERTSIPTYGRVGAGAGTLRQVITIELCITLAGQVNGPGSAPVITRLEN
ncbi:hypothetical protein J6590_000078 [Homalodisca vitripennis]|nr:hypothetical protein J6590_000078 [Homalodisca vitripennis]